MKPCAMINLQGGIGWKYEPQTQPHPPNYTRQAHHQPTAPFFTNYTHGMREESGLRSALADFIFFSFFFFYVSFILLFTLMVCCGGNSLVKIRRNGKQRMEKSDHHGTNKGGPFRFLPHIVSRARRVRGGGIESV
ncbi:hypothetical protein FVEG_16139 [Fusarium verticillioides 7600]|uniref:Uncharacterized protein n=1 Tax=Gibberella moniliformis (strain M3125 / FGSC 7600) TaxID=334819 RepID=W7MIQ5_GIBM7|nr:hypothetical protein FVEG_16139 [Fusarium verticillioides 7600]EWG47475.1 hypothetical protein FVEG_16139 [Fusarium verticillioides 7600]